MSLALSPTPRHSRARGNPDGARNEAVVRFIHEKILSWTERAEMALLYDHLGPRVRGDDDGFLRIVHPC